MHLGHLQLVRHGVTSASHVHIARFRALGAIDGTVLLMHPDVTGAFALHTS